MPSRKKVNLQKVLASLNANCPKCGRVIKPNEISRLKFKGMICPACGAIFDPLDKPKPDPSRRA